MAGITAYIAETVFKLIDEQSRYIEDDQGAAAGREVRKLFRNAMKQVEARPYSLATTLYCPPNYKRVNVKPFQIFYRINEEKQELTFYSIRGGRQRPLAASTHRSYAGAAEKDRTKL